MAFIRFRRPIFAGSALWLCVGLSLCSCSASKPLSPTAEAVPISPQQLAGDWLVETKIRGEAAEERLHFALINGILAGSVIGPDGNAQELSKLEIDKDKLSWNVESDSQTERIEATVEGTSMKGTIKVERHRNQEDESGSGRSSGGSPWGGRGGARGGGRFGGHGGGGWHGRSSNDKIKFTAYKLDVSAPKDSAH
jgi:uncharacterized membrane protein YgcG